MDRPRLIVVCSLVYSECRRRLHMSLFM